MTRRPRAIAGKSPKETIALEVLRQFRVIVKSIRLHYQVVERRAGIGGAQLWSLAQIARTPGVKVGEFAHSLAIHQSTASNLLGQLEDAKLIERRREDGDRRTVTLFATAKGRALLRNAPRPHSGVLQQALANLPQETLEALHQHLDVLIGAMKAKDLRARATPLSEI